MGWAPRANAQARRQRRVGDFHPRRRRRRQLQIWRSSDGTARYCRSRPIRSASKRNFGLRPRRSSPPTRLTNGTMTSICARASKLTHAARRCRSIKFICRSWRRGDGERFLTYDELAEQLVPYVADLGFTHIELMPVTHYSARRLLGLSAYRAFRADAPAWRIPYGFRRLIDRAHQGGIERHSRRVPAHSRPTNMASRISTADRSTSIPTPGAAFIQTGILRSMITAGAKWGISSSPARSIGWSASISTGCASTPSPRRLSRLFSQRGRMDAYPDGSNDNRDAVAFLQRFNELVYGFIPVSRRSPRN